MLLNIYTLPELVDLALKVPEVGAINFNILHTVLSVLVQETGLRDLMPWCHIENPALARSAMTERRLVRAHRRAPSHGSADMEKETRHLKRLVTFDDVETARKGPDRLFDVLTEIPDRPAVAAAEQTDPSAAERGVESEPPAVSEVTGGAEALERISQRVATPEAEASPSSTKASETWRAINLDRRMEAAEEALLHIANVIDLLAEKGGLSTKLRIPVSDGSDEFLEIDLVELYKKTEEMESLQAKSKRDKKKIARMDSKIQDLEKSLKDLWAFIQENLGSGPGKTDVEGGPTSKPSEEKDAEGRVGETEERAEGEAGTDVLGRKTSSEEAREKGSRDEEGGKESSHDEEDESDSEDEYSKLSPLERKKARELEKERRRAEAEAAAAASPANRQKMKEMEDGMNHVLEEMESSRVGLAQTQAELQNSLDMIRALEATMETRRKDQKAMWKKMQDVYRRLTELEERVALLEKRVLHRIEEESRLGPLGRFEFETALDEMGEAMGRMAIKISSQAESLETCDKELRAELSMRTTAEEMAECRKCVEGRVRLVASELEKLQRLIEQLLYPDSAAVTRCLTCGRDATISDWEYVDAKGKDCSVNGQRHAGGGGNRKRDDSFKRNDNSSSDNSSPADRVVRLPVIKDSSGKRRIAYGRQDSMNLSQDEREKRDLVFTTMVWDATQKKTRTKKIGDQAQSSSEPETTQEQRYSTERGRFHSEPMSTAPDPLSTTRYSFQPLRYMSQVVRRDDRLTTDGKKPLCIAAPIRRKTRPCGHQR